MKGIPAEVDSYATPTAIHSVKGATIPPTDVMKQETLSGRCNTIFSENVESRGVGWICVEAVVLLWAEAV
eukprot:4482921-Amphidinium_carterae.1